MSTFRLASPSPFRFIALPNLVSYLSFLFALGTMHEASRGSWHGAGAFIAASALADMFDGKFARLFKRSKAHATFGAELDSLIDVVGFGVAPLITLRLLAFPDTEAGQWGFGLAASAYLLATVTRLGYFNIHQAATNSGTFVGLPTTFVGTIWGLLFLTPATGAMGPWILGALAVLMLVPVEFSRPKGLLFWIAPALALTAIVVNWRGR